MKQYLTLSHRWRQSEVISSFNRKSVIINKIFIEGRQNSQTFCNTILR